MSKNIIGEYHARTPPRTEAKLTGLFLASNSELEDFLLFPCSTDPSGRLMFPSEIHDKIKNEIFVELYAGPEREFFNIYSGELVTLKTSINDRWLLELKKKPRRD